ncbi:MAG: hypothetical protein Q9187_004735 [Circinaria calcarea]
MDSILDGLNAAQKSAVTSPASVLQILAPPGSGKTKTLTSRVAYLLSHQNYQPWNVICLTFTIKSAKEMKERIAKLIGNGLEAKIVLGTFHSVCRRYLVTYGHLIGIRKGFGIADSADSISIINRIVKRLKLSIDPKAARTRISCSKARSIGCAELRLGAAKKSNVDQQQFITVFEAYQDHLATSNLLDYDDLLLRCVDLLRQHPTCVSNVEVVLIDEFQDTNLIQFDLMRLFAAKNKRITTVGDPDQSIYGWRSAEIENLKRMQRQYPDTLVIHLEDNYRSSGGILLAALELIQQDDSRPPKPLLPTHCPGTTPVLRRLPSAAIEAAWIVSEIQRTIGLTGDLLSLSDFAILLRSASLSRHIESAMGKAGIPYCMVGGQRFFDRIEIKILLDYLRVISQPDNSNALARIVNVPSRRIGDVTIKSLLEEADAKAMTLWSLARDAVQGHITPKTKISKSAEQGLNSLINIILTARKKTLDIENPHPPRLILEYVMKRIDFQEYLEKSYSEDHEARWANVEELLAQASDLPQLAQDPNSSEEDADEEVLPYIDGLVQEVGNEAEEALSKFLANIALSSEIQRDDEVNRRSGRHEKITISTIHAAKGLEWPCVFIPSAYEGSIPHSRAEDTDEERRLLYVAMTRAQALLYMSCPVRNSMGEETTISPFLSSKKVAFYLTNKGPSIGSSVIQDISYILRRKYPSQQAIEYKARDVENMEDSLWPLDGEQDPKAVETKWSKHDRTTSILYSTHTGRYSGITKIADEPSTRHTHPTAMTSIGFVTANSHLQHVKQEEARGRKRPKDDGVRQKRGEDVRFKRIARDQGSLLELWESKKGNGETTISTETSRSARSITKSQDRESRVDTETLTTVSSTTLPRKRLGSKSIIPESLAGHTLRPLLNTNHLRTHSAISEQTSRPYVFLSSSPPNGQELLKEAEVHPPPIPYQKPIKVNENLGPCIATVNSDIRPSSTFHTTSILQLQSKENVPRRTLGVRRKANKIPTPIDLKGEIISLLLGKRFPATIYDKVVAASQSDLCKVTFADLYNKMPAIPSTASQLIALPARSGV